MLAKLLVVCDTQGEAANIAVTTRATFQGVVEGECQMITFVQLTLSFESNEFFKLLRPLLKLVKPDSHDKCSQSAESKGRAFGGSWNRRSGKRARRPQQAARVRAERRGRAQQGARADAPADAQPRGEQND